MALDYILRISFAAGATRAEELVQSAIFMASSSGSSWSDAEGTTLVEAYFEDRESRSAAMELLNSVPGLDLLTLDRAGFDWLDHYQQSLHAIEIGRRFLIAPDRDLLPERTERLAIVIPQERAFGTGSHETTALCLETLEGLDLEGLTAVDIGSGSGILGIAMKLLGARKVFAFDNDLEAMSALCDNRSRNAVPESSMPVFIGGMEALRPSRFDVATMNILPEVIIPLLGPLSSHLAAAAHLVLSGILTERREEIVLAASTHRLDLVAQREKGEWWCGLFEKRG